MKQHTIVLNVLTSFLITFLCAFSTTSVAAPTPTASGSPPSSSFVGESFCYTTEFTNSAAEIGYGPYYQLILNPDFSFESATFNGLGLTVNSNDVFPASGILVDPVSGQNVSGVENGRLVVLSAPVGSVSNQQLPIGFEICLGVDSSAVVDVVQPNAITLVPGFVFGDSATGVPGTDTILGTPQQSPFTPKVIKYTISDGRPEGEHPPGPVWTFPVKAVANIAADRTVTPIEFPTITIPGNVKFVGPLTINGGSNCVFTPDVTTLEATTGVGNDVDIDISCASGTGSIGSSQEIVADFKVYIVDTLENNSCSNESALNTAKHFVLRKSSSSSGIPGSIVTNTLSYQTSEFIPGLSGLKITDILGDGLFYVPEQPAPNPATLLLNISHEGINTTLSVPILPDGINSKFENADIYAAIVAAGGSIGPGESGTITYQTQISQTYDNGDPVLTRDTINNSVGAVYDLIGTLTAKSCPENSASSVQIRNVTISKSTIGNTQVVPGQIVQYRLTMDIPSGDADNVEFTDVLPLPVFSAADFLAFTGDLDTYSANNVAINGASLAYGPGSFKPAQVVISNNPASNSVTVNFGDINSPTGVTLVVDLFVKASNEPYADGLSLANLLNAESNSTTSDSAVGSTATQILVRAPKMIIESEITSPLTAPDGQDPITFKVTLTNQGGAPSFNVNVTSNFSPHIDPSTCTAPTVSGSGSFSVAGTPSMGMEVTNNSITGDVGETGGGNDQPILTFTCELRDNTPVNTAVISDFNLEYAAGPNQTKFPIQTASTTITTASPAVEYELIATSEPSTGVDGSRTKLTLGEIARFRMRAKIPEGNLGSASLKANLPDELVYLDDGSAKIAFVSNNAAITSTSSSITSAGCTLASTLSTVTPNCTIAANTATFTDGVDPVFNLGTLSNIDNDSDDEYVVLEFNAYQRRQSDNEISAPDNYDFSDVDYDSSATITASTATVNSTEIELKRVIPQATVDIQVDSATAVGGKELTYTIDITSPGASTAIPFDLNIKNVVPAGMTFVTNADDNTSAVFSGCSPATNPTADVSSPSAGNGIVLSLTQLPIGETCQFTYKTKVDQNVALGQILNSKADLTWTSLPNTNTTLSGSTIAKEQSYKRSDTVKVTVDGTTLNKSVVSTTQSHTSDTGGATDNNPLVLSIGEEITYKLKTTIPTGTAQNLVIKDVLPVGLSYVANSARVALVVDTNNELVSSTVTTCTSGTLYSTDENVTPDCPLAPSITGQQLQFIFGNVVNSDTGNDTEFIIIQFTAKVANTLANQQNVQLDNKYTSLLDGTQDAESNTLHAKIVEPKIDLTITPNPSTVDNRTDETPTVGWTATLSNTGEAQAFQVKNGSTGNWQIELPEGVETITGLQVAITGDVTRNGTTTSIVSGDFSVSGADNNILTLAHPLSLDPGASITVTFNTNLKASVTPGSTLSDPAKPSVLTYTGQETGDNSTGVRDDSNITTGTGNNPITSTASGINDYRTEVPITVITQNSAPQLGVAKQLVSSTMLANGSFNLSYRVLIENKGDVDLIEVQATDNLASVFGGLTGFVVNSQSLINNNGATLRINSGFDGDTDTRLIDPDFTGQRLDVNQSVTINFEVVIIPAGNTAADLQTYQNTVNTTAISARNAAKSVSDDSNDGSLSDPDNNGVAGDNSTPTPVVLATSPSLGLAKAITSVVNNGDGTYNIVYDFVLKNTGDVNIANAQITDDLSSTFPTNNSIQIISHTATLLSVNGDYDGVTKTNLFAANQILPKGQTATSRLEIKVEPTTNLGPYSNSAQASGTSPWGKSVTDSSDNGSNPETNNGEGGSNDPSVITFDEGAELGVAKALVEGPTNNHDGTYTVGYQVKVKNTGVVNLTDVQVTENLDTVFGAGRYALLGLITSTGSVHNTNFNGSSNTNLLQANTGLIKNQEIEINFRLTLTPGDQLGVKENQVEATGVTPIGLTTSDDSDNGADPETNNGNAAGDDVTPVTLAEAPALAIAKEVVGAPLSNQDGTYQLNYRFNIKNTGDVNLQNVQIVDDLVAIFGDAQKIVSATVTSTDLTPNANFNGVGDTNLLASGQSLAHTATAVVDLALVIRPGTTLGSYDNQATLSATSPSGATVTDLSDSGSDPETNNGSGGLADKTPVTFVEDAKSIGVANRISAGPTNNGDGTYTLTYQIKVENTGDIELNDVQLDQNLNTVFADADSFNVDSISSVSGSAVVNPNYNGTSNTEILDSGLSLAVGESSVIAITVTVTPGSDLGAYNSQVTASANSPSGIAVTDLSDNGADATTDNGAGGSDDPTPVTFVESPSVGLAKAVNGSITNNQDGTYTFNYRLIVKNTGDVNASDVQVVDNLSTVFTAPATIDSVQISSSDLTINNNYNGTGVNELLAAGQTLAVSESATIDMQVVITPNSNLGPYNNTAEAQITSPSGATFSDTSDNGSDPETNNGNAQGDDPTPVSFTEAPALGLAKAINGSVVNNEDGTYTLNYRFVLKNTGDVEARNVQITDDLSSTFAAPASVGTVQVSSSDLTVNNSFNGTGNNTLLAPNQTLAVGVSATVDLQVTITPSSNLGEHKNSATASGTSPSGDAITDQSDNGSNPEGNNGDGDDKDFTPITFTEAPAINVASEITSGPTNNGDGTYDVQYTVIVKNTGDIDLSNVQLDENFAGVFGTAPYQVSSISSPQLTANASFNGDGNTGLLAANQNLAVGESATVVVNLRITPQSQLGPYNSQIEATATSPSTATPSDLSDNGSNPETNNGAGTNDDPTPLVFTEAPAIAAAKSISAGPTNNGDGTYDMSYRLVVKNTGDIVLNNVQIVEDLATVFGANKFQVLSTTAGTLSLNNSFDGSANTSLYAASQSLAVGQQDIVILNLRITPADTLGPYDNQITASATSPAGTGVTDVSDNGTDPESDNGSGGLDDVTSITFTESPAIGAAKAISHGPIHNGDGTYDIDYTLVVKNTGDVRLDSVSVTENLANVFGINKFQIQAVTSTYFDINTDYDGQSDIQLTQQNKALLVGQSETIVVELLITPGTNLGPYANQVTAGGTSPALDTVNDLSDSGSDTETDNGFNGTDDKTLVSFNEDPAAIGAANRITNGPINNGDGTYTLTYQAVVGNTGSIILNDVQLDQNLDTVFADAASYQVDSISAISGPIAVNPNYDGSTNASLLQSNQTLPIGGSAVVEYTVTVTPSGDLGPYNSQINATATSPSGVDVDDLSDDGANTSGNNGSGQDDDPTPVSFTEAPALGLAKAINGPVVNNEDGTYTLNYRFVLKNTGDVEARNVQITDDLSSTFAAPASVGTVQVSSTDLTVNSSFNGTGNNTLLAPNQTLAVGVSATVDLQVTITPSSNLGEHKNSATASGTSPSGDAITDQSDNGSNPEGNNGDGDDKDFTPITFTEAPAINVASEITSGPTNNGDGTYDVQYTVVVKNTGDIDLTDVQLDENFAGVFGTAPYQVSSISSPQLTANANFNGNGNTGLLAANQNLAVGESATVVVNLRITPQSQLGPYNSQIEATATSPSTATPSDLSDNGSNPETNNGSGTNDDPTPLVFTEAPAIAAAKSISAGPTNNGDGTYDMSYRLVVKNTGDIVLNNVQIVEDLATVFGANKFQVLSTTAGTLSLNNSFDGSANTSLYAASQSLAVGQQDIVILNLRITPADTLGPYGNQITASATSPAGTGVTDASDNGTDPESDNGSGGLDDVTSITFIEAPAIGAAKAISAGPVNKGNGSYELEYTIVVKNTGDIALSDVQIDEPLANVFGANRYSINSVSATTLSTNAQFDGNAETALLAANQTLSAGQSDNIVIKLTITPGATLGPYDNQVAVTGVSPAGNTVSDNSDAGTDPETDNGAGDSDDPTTVTFAEAPAIGVAKAISTQPVNKGDGTYDMEYTIVVKNTGDIALSNVQVDEPLATVFGANHFTIVSVTSANLTVNPQFDGNSSTGLLAASQILEAGQSESIVLKLTITPESNLGPYDNQVTANGLSPAGSTVTDKSDAGNDPEGDNGAGGNDDPTSITFAENPSIVAASHVSSGPSNNGDGTYALDYTFVIKNNGDIELGDLSFGQSLSDLFGDGKYQLVGVTADNLALNPNYDGNANTRLIEPNQSLTAGQSESVVLKLIVTPGENLGPYQQQLQVSATSPAGTTVTDASDEGTNPETDNGAGGLDDPTVISFSESPKVNTAKFISNGPIQNGDGTYGLEYTIIIQNTGDIALSNVSLIDDLASVFGPNAFVVNSITSDDLTVNSAFNGATDKELLASNSTLTVSQKGSVKLLLTITPGANLGPYANQASVSGVSPSGSAVSDLSDSGDNPETDNGEGGVDDATVVTFVESPAIASAKALISGPTNNGDGTYSISYRLTLKNTGDIVLNNVQIDEPLAQVFGSGKYQVVSVTPLALTANDQFDGEVRTGLLAANQSLVVGQTETVELALLITPADNLGPYENQVNVSGQSPSGLAVSDLSDSGLNPETDNGSGGMDDKTPVSFTEAPDIGVAKRVVDTPVLSADGTYALTYEFVVKNTGDISLKAVQISENLVDAFGQDKFSVTSVSSDTLSVNDDFDGVNDIELLDAQNTLAVGESKLLTLQLVITPGDNLGPYENQVNATATSPAGAAVSDLSDNGSNPEGDNGEGTEEDKTSITFTEKPAIAIAHEISDGPINNGDGSYDVEYTLVVKNIGDVNLDNLQLTDQLANTFGTAEVEVISTDTADPNSALTLNNSFNGAADQNLLAAGQTLAAGATETIKVRIKVTPKDNLGPYELQTQVVGTSPSGVGVSDLSDNGSDPETDNGAGTLDDKTPLEFSENPSVGIAKQLTAEPVNNGDGTYTLSYLFNAKNTGDIVLHDLQIKENLANTFAGANPTFVSLTSDQLTVNPNFDGVNDVKLLSDNQSFAVNAEAQLLLTLVVTPGNNLGPYQNQVKAEGVSPAGKAISDLSDNGTNPEGDNGSGTDADTTPVLFTEDPDIGIALTMNGDIVATVNGQPGNFDVPFRAVIKNTGNIKLTNLQVATNMLAQFEDAYVSVSEGPTLVIDDPQKPGVLELPTFGPQPELNLFDGQSGALLPGQELVVDFTIEFFPGSPIAAFTMYNSLQTSAVSTGGEKVSDISDSGENPTDDAAKGGDNPDAAGDTGGTDDPTPFDLPSGRVQGQLWIDSNLNDLKESDEKALAGWNVRLTDVAGNVLAQGPTIATGQFSFINVPQGDYRVEILSPTGVTYQETEVKVLADENVKLPVPVDPSGVVYDSVTREPVEGTKITMVNEQGIPLDPSCLLPDQQDQVTGPDGYYFFLLFLDAHPSCPAGGKVELKVTPPVDKFLPGVSELIKPLEGPLDATGLPSPYSVGVDAEPPAIGENTDYYLSFVIDNGDPDIVNNHIAVDSIGVSPNMVRLTKTAGQKTILAGGLVQYTVKVENIGTVGLTDLTLVDTPPKGFSYVNGSLSVKDVDGKGTISVDRKLSINNIDVAAKSEAIVKYILRAGADIKRGEHVNTVAPFIGDAPIGNPAQASVTSGSDPDFEEMTVLGKVFNDADGDYWQDSALATGITVKGGIAPSAYIADSTLLITSVGVDALEDASAPINHGIKIDQIAGRSSQAESIEPYQVIIRQKMSRLDFTNDFVLTTDQGTVLRMDAKGKLTLSHKDAMAEGRSSQKLVVTRQVAVIEQGYQVDFVIQNKGINEIGIPGVRVASVKGIYAETDAYGRYHIAANDVVNRTRGHNMLLKVDVASLPKGSEVISENPRVQRVTQGVPAQFDFAVKLHSEMIGAGEERVQLKVSTLLFDNDSVKIKPEYAELIKQIADKVNYYRGGVIYIHATANNPETALARAIELRKALSEHVYDDVLDKLTINITHDGTQKGVIMKVKDTFELSQVFFDNDRANVKPQYDNLLRSVAVKMAKTNITEVRLEAFADINAAADYNMKLSLRRAKSVLKEISAYLPAELREKLVIKVQQFKSSNFRDRSVEPETQFKSSAGGLK